MFRRFSKGPKRGGRECPKRGQTPALPRAPRRGNTRSPQAGTGSDPFLDKTPLWTTSHERSAHSAHRVLPWCTSLGAKRQTKNGRSEKAQRSVVAGLLG